MMRRIPQCLAEELYSIWKDNERIPGEVRFEKCGEELEFKILDEKDIYMCMTPGVTFQVEFLVNKIVYADDVIVFFDAMGSSIVLSVVG